MKHSPFVHLHVHTQYSLLDGAIRLEDLFRKAKGFSMQAVAITDHGNMFGAIDFYQGAYRAGIKPIIGCEIYVAPRSRFDKESQAGDGARHLVLLARNAAGYGNLMKLTSAGFLEGFYYRPRIDKQILAEHSEGLIALSACLHGEISNLLLKGDYEGAKKVALEYRGIFGEGNFFLEIMENGLPEQSVANEGLIKLSKETSIPLVATNDCHYLQKSDAESHEILLCIQTGKTIEDPDHMKFGSDQFYFRSPEEMQKLFAYCPEAVENTVLIAERCNLSLSFDNIYLPHFQLQGDITLDGHLKAMAQQGLARILTGLPPLMHEAYRKRLESELDIIQSMGFSGYFLIVSDFVNYAKSRQIPVGPGRGSGAGSLVAYALNITNIDPIHYGLFFERFLNPDRKSMPDMDIDFCMEGRDEIIHYVMNKYGRDRVAQIITFGTMQARAAIRDVGRALNIPYGEVDRIAKLVPNVPGITLEKALGMEPRLQEEIKKNEKIKKLIEMSKGLENLNRHSSTHAAGVVISDKPLVERVPLCKTSNDDVVTQFSMDDLQRVGLTKFDFLGLRTLTVIKNTIDFIRQSRGESIDINEIPLDDLTTYQLLNRGDTDGVFQLESAGMKEILVNMKPDCVEDIIALIALYRPGPLKSGMVQEFVSRKQGKTKIVYELPQLESILKETYGVIIYQEQVMQIAVALANYTMGEADSLRKAMSKKDPAEMERVKPQFMQGAKKNKISEAKARKIFEQVETFAGYGFNKSHSAAYAMISYQTAYLKAHYPVEFMAALLTSEKNNRDKIIKHISGCRSMNIDVLPPDINDSLRDFSVVGNRIRFGLAAVKHVGVGAIEAILAAREDEGRFKSFAEFLSRVDLRRINKRVIESLIKCGAFDSLENSRRGLMETFEATVEAVHKKNRGARSQTALFVETPESAPLKTDEPDIAEWPTKELLSYEKETLGFYITSHPLVGFADRLSSVITADSENINEKRDGEVVTVAGIVSLLKEKLTKKKEAMGDLVLEDLKGSIGVIVFSELYRNSQPLLHGQDPLVIKGRIDVGEESTKIIASSITKLENAEEFKIVRFYIDSSSSNDSIANLKEIIMGHLGTCDAFVHIVVPHKSETVIYLGRDLRIKSSTSLKADVELILGQGSIRFE